MNGKKVRWGIIFVFLFVFNVSIWADDVEDNIKAISAGNIVVALKVAGSGDQKYKQSYQRGIKALQNTRKRKKMRKAYLLFLKANTGAEGVNRDRKNNEWTFYKNVNGVKTSLLIVRDINNDQIPNREIRFTGGTVNEAVEDTNGDLKFDIFENYQDGRMIKKSIDNDFDDLFDLVENYEEYTIVSVEIYSKGALEQKKFDKNRDNTFDKTERYANGVIQSAESDTNYDGAVDLIEKYKDGVILTSKYDADFNGVYDQYSEYSNNGLNSTRTYKDGSGAVHKIERYFRDTILHAKIDGNRDGKFEFIAEYENGLIAKSKTDTDHDGIFNIFSTYKGGTLIFQEIDENNDGSFDTFVNVFDMNNDTKIDRWEYKDNNGIVTKISKDTNIDEKEDIWEFYEAGKIVKIEYDLNFDNHIDKRETLNEKGEVVKIYLDADLNDSVFAFDKFEYYSNNLLTRREWDCDKDSNFDCSKDNKVDKIELFDVMGNMFETGYDIKNNDGKMDYWEYFEHGRLCKKGHDKNIDGKADYIEILNDEGKTVGEMEDTDFDGTFDKFTFSDKWAYLNERKHYDRDAFYRNKDLIILEFDQNNNGKIDRWEFYNKNKKKLKVEIDDNEDGKVNQWVYFDKWEYYGIDEKIVKTKTDLTHDGIADQTTNEDDPMAYYVDNVFKDYNSTVDQLILDLKYGVSSVRKAGAIRLAELVKKGDQKAVNGFTVLVKALKDKSREVVIAAVNSLGDFEDTKAIVPLSKLLVEIDPEINVATIEAMASLGTSEAVTYLHGFLTMVNGKIKETLKNKKEKPQKMAMINMLTVAAINGMAHIADIRSVSVIIPYIDGKYAPTVRKAAVKALGHYLDDRAIKPLGDRI
ncbi:MAG: HEAT repeat domain-containing protein [Candidatus Anammoxibacter sp.]